MKQCEKEPFEPLKFKLITIKDGNENIDKYQLVTTTSEEKLKANENMLKQYHLFYNICQETSGEFFFGFSVKKEMEKEEIDQGVENLKKLKNIINAPENQKKIFDWFKEKLEIEEKIKGVQKDAKKFVENYETTHQTTPDESFLKIEEKRETDPLSHLPTGSGRIGKLVLAPKIKESEYFNILQTVLGNDFLILNIDKDHYDDNLKLVKQLMEKQKQKLENPMVKKVIEKYFEEIEKLKEKIESIKEDFFTLTKSYN